MIPLSTNDRIGGNILSYIATICYCHKNNIYIDNINGQYNGTMYVRILNELINDINSKSTNSDKSFNLSNLKHTYHNYLCYISCLCTLSLKEDIYTYFKRNFGDFVESKLKESYKVDFDNKKSITIHHRLDDTNFSNRIDFDGNTSSSYFLNIINNDNLNNFSFNDEINHLKQLGIEKDFNLYNAQGPISDSKLENILNKVKKEYPDYQVNLVCSKIGNLTFNNVNKIIRSDDYNYDLYCLICSDILVGSRSVYSLVAAFFHFGSKIYYPKWSVAACCGMYSKYDKSNIEYFS